MTIKSKTKVPAKKVVAKKVIAKKSTPAVVKKPAVKAVRSTTGNKKITKSENVMTIKTEQVTDVQTQDVQQNDQPITGRGVFAVRTLGDAVSVEAAFLAEDGNVLRLPAVFPNREYALGQIDELRQIVNQHFDQLGK